MEKIKKFIPIIVGIVLICAGVFFYFRSSDLARKCTEEATATVVDMREELDASAEEMRYMYYPIIQYEVEGRKIEKQMESGTNVPAYRINETISILYNPDKVDEYIVAGENQSIIWVILSGVGVAFLGVGIYLLVTNKA